jgi:hypothetical protein
MIKSNDTKPDKLVLRLAGSALGATRCPTDSAEFPLRLEQDWNGHYWAMAHGGELYWWRLVKCNAATDAPPADRRSPAETRNSESAATRREEKSRLRR